MRKPPEGNIDRWGKQELVKIRLLGRGSFFLFDTQFVTNDLLVGFSYEKESLH